VLKQAAQPGANDAPHTALAGSKAYLALGRAQLAADKPSGAVECAKAGLAELGPNYIAPTAMDDTDLKVLAAEDLVGAGQVADGATTLLRVLEERIGLYEQLHASELAPLTAP
jgi:hypothetical protein